MSPSKAPRPRWEDRGVQPMGLRCLEETVGRRTSGDLKMVGASTVLACLDKGHNPPCPRVPTPLHAWRAGGVLGAGRALVEDTGITQLVSVPVAPQGRGTGGWSWALFQSGMSPRCSCPSGTSHGVFRALGTPLQGAPVPRGHLTGSSGPWGHLSRVLLSLGDISRGLQGLGDTSPGCSCPSGTSHGVFKALGTPLQGAPVPRGHLTGSSGPWGHLSRVLLSLGDISRGLQGLGDTSPGCSCPSGTSHGVFRALGTPLQGAPVPRGHLTGSSGPWGHLSRVLLSLGDISRGLQGLGDTRPGLLCPGDIPKCVLLLRTSSWRSCLPRGHPWVSFFPKRCPQGVSHDLGTSPVPFRSSLGTSPGVPPPPRDVPRGSITPWGHPWVSCSLGDIFGGRPKVFLLPQQCPHILPIAWGHLQGSHLP
ncbi:uncharacterized protein [Ciconia boyciana]|uniref:uncharacterized protein n=1 Tax=Ciconia boyciana TaxID=52775 RepID=UPI003BA17051